MKMLLSRFAGRRAGFYVSLVSAVLILAIDVAYIASDYGDRTFSPVTFALMLVGALLTIAYCITGFKFLDFIPAVSCIVYGFAFGQHLILALESLSDVWNQVNFVGGNATLGAVFAGLFLVPVVAAAVGAFMREDCRDSAHSAE